MLLLLFFVKIVTKFSNDQMMSSSLHASINTQMLSQFCSLRTELKIKYFYSPDSSLVSTRTIAIGIIGYIDRKYYQKVHGVWYQYFSYFLFSNPLL